tara:strand:+ start:1020 stop:1277 length:258 start_codon:yes stop_codon:yes gene_type:complete
MMMKYLSKFISIKLIFIIRLYQLILSPILKTNCRYLPSCSEYSIIALKEYGFMKGIYYSILRIFKCHPFGGSGYDPVPKKNKEEI